MRRRLDIDRMTSIPILSGFDGVRLERLADWLAVGVAVSLPWSTSATGILIAVWLITVLPTLDAASVRRELATAAGGLPVLLWVLAAVGMLWADVTWAERIGGLGKFHRLLVIPLLLAQFRRSEHGVWVIYGFFASMLGLLLTSWVAVAFPGLPWPGKEFGVPVKDYIIQGETFLICAFALLGRAFDERAAKNPLFILGLVGLAVLFLVNIAFVATGRTVLLVAPVLALLLGWRQFRWKGLLAAALLGGIVGAALFFESPYLHARLENSATELQDYLSSDAMNSTGLHLEFLRKSLSFVETAPIMGHGTGSITEQFRNAAAVGQTGASSVASGNPHNQIFAVAIQFGLIGTVVLLAMWTAHIMLFRGNGSIAWIGLIVVVQNIVSSLFNSHLFDFTQGWLYVFGVGVVGGTVLRAKSAAAATSRMAKP
jgi:O-antigen ligase